MPDDADGVEDRCGAQPTTGDWEIVVYPGDERAGTALAL